jgi:electron transfer flavoprotein alpha subunit
MRIAVLAKQVPRPAELTLVDGRLVRDGVGLETNAYCRRANARAVQLVAENGEDGEVVVFSMGPPSAESTLREMVACGANRGVLVSDPVLAGSDTLITAQILAAAIQNEGPFDIVFTGAYSLDSETGHIGVQLAELLGLPFIGPCRTLDIIDGVAVATVESEGGYVDVEVLLPMVASAAERLCGPSKASPEQIATVPAERISYVTAADLGLESYRVGLGASPTQVGAEARALVANERMQVKTTSIDEAIKLLDALADAECEELNAADEIARPEDIHTGAVWCILDPTGPEADENFLSSVVAVARRAGRPTVAVVGDGVVEPGSLGRWVDRVVQLTGPTAPEDWIAPLTERLQDQRPQSVVVEGTNWGRELAARTAARLGWGLVGDAVDLTVDDGALLAWKSAFSGQAIVPITSSSPVLLVTVRPGTLSGTVAPQDGHVAPVEVVPTTSVSRVIYSPGRDIDTVGREVSLAARLIVVGAGVAPEDYEAVHELRELLGAGPLAGTRKVTDQGWLPRSRQIGITGRAVAPELLVSIGANGGFNHSVGFGRATRVLAINQNEDAPIFELADVGIVGDWREVVAALSEALRARAADRIDAEQT